MKAEQIYKKIKEIINTIHSHQDQMVAISKWIEDEFEPKATPSNIDSGMLGTLKIRKDRKSGCESCLHKEQPIDYGVCKHCLSNNKYAEYYE